jgi:hypothetical protein
MLEYLAETHNVDNVGAVATWQSGSTTVAQLHHPLGRSALVERKEVCRGQVFDDRGVGGSRAELRSNRTLKKMGRIGPVIQEQTCRS